MLFSVATASDMVPARRINPWLVSLYSAVITALITLLFTRFFRNEQLVGYIIALLLIGIGPVLGYLLAGGSLRRNWPALIGGIIGSIPIVGPLLLWPLLVGALGRSLSIGRLFLGSILGVILAVVVFLLIQSSSIGQDPTNFSFVIIGICAIWGAVCGAFMARPTN